MRRPPKFVNGYIDRHGKPRFYFRRAGFKKVPLPGLPWSPEFMAAYHHALDLSPRVEIGADMENHLPRLPHSETSLRIGVSRRD